MRMRAHWVGLLIGTLLFATTTPLLAQGPSTTGATDDAREHYERGLKLYGDGAYDAARTEFERAYALAPTYKLLYNVGVVHAQLSDFVGAVHNLKRYLAEGGDQIPQARRDEVTALLKVLKQRIAAIRVTTNVPGADISIDDVVVGHTPLSEPIEANPGRRKITAMKSGWLPTSKVVDVAGLDSISVPLVLVEPTKVTIVTDRPSRRVPWLGWGITAALAAGAGVMGYFAIQESGTLKDMKSKPAPDPSQLSSESSKVQVFSLVADLVGVAAVAAGAVSLYLTVKWGNETPNKAAPPRATLRLGPAGPGLGAIGTF